MNEPASPRMLRRSATSARRRTGKWVARLGRLVVVVLATVAIVAFVTAIAPSSHHLPADRPALNALAAWRRQPSPETEAAWIAAREELQRQRAVFFWGAFTVSVVAGAGAAVLAHYLAKRAKATRDG